MTELNLDERGKKMPYKVPEAYFEQAAQKAKLLALPKRTFFVRPWHIGVAVASVAIIVVALIVLPQEKENPIEQYDQLLAQASDELLYDYNQDWQYYYQVEE